MSTHLHWMVEASEGGARARRLLAALLVAGARDGIAEPEPEPEPDPAARRRMAGLAQVLSPRRRIVESMPADEGARDSAAGGTDDVQRALQAMMERASLPKDELSAVLDPLAWLQLQARHSREFADQDVGQPAERDGLLAHELRTALRFAKASYGTAMEDGHMSSVLRTTYMWTARPLVTGVDVRLEQGSQDRSVCEQAGVSHLLSSDWSGGVFRPGHFVAYEPTHDWLVLAVRGTLRPDDLLTDACAAPCRFGGGFAHEGVSRAAHWVVAQATGVIAAALSTHPTARVVVTGHSMGGATATLVAALLRAQARAHPESAAASAFAAARAIAFAPLPVLSSTLAMDDEHRRFSLSVVCGCDFAPRLSIEALSRLRQELQHAGLRAAGDRALQRLRRIVDLGGSRPAEKAAAAGAGVEAGAGAERGGEKRLAMAGRVLYLPPPSDATPPQPSRACWAEANDFSRLLVTEGCLRDHLVSRYEAALDAFAAAADGDGTASSSSGSLADS
eukprot:COSAG04_NODE_3387_length_2865_cov_6.902497_1_plen_504_part_10